MKNKPTEAYLRLQEAWAQQEQAEIEQKQKAMLESAINEQEYFDKLERMNYSNNRRMIEENNYKTYMEIKDTVKTSLLESALSIIVKKSLPTVIASEHSKFIDSIVSDFIQEEGGVYPLLDRMRNKTFFLSELADDIENTAEEETEDVEPEEPDTIMVKSQPATDLITKIEGDETVEDISNIIKAKVSRATEEFMEKNIIDQTDIKDTLADVKQRMETVRTGDDALDKEIRQEATINAKRKIAEIHNRSHGVFEHLVLNMSHAVLSNDSIRESYVSESNKLDMDAIVEKCTCIYTIMEMANTIRLKEFNESNIDKYISFDN